MEYSGVITIGEGLYSSYRDQLAFLAAHETAHQWWYVQVGNDPLVYPWLDEGLAEYAVFDYYREVFSPERAGALRDRRWRRPVESGSNQALLNGAVDRPAWAMVEDNYQLLAYAKSALFFDALRRELGDEVYREVLRQYVETYRWQVSTPQDFLGVAQNVSGVNLNRLAETWLR
jgi:aminopeptidase N